MGSGQVWLVSGALFGGAGVVLGAFGAHALRDRLGETALQTWQTAVSYQFVHALALLAVGILIRLSSHGGGSDRLLGVAGGAFALGVLLFSGSLYVLALGGPRWLGPITPIGGVAFIAGWIAMAVALLRPLSNP
jgi:uncharacterized membrane protein YgdD (TMEM256/DUF423 family)